MSVIIVVLPDGRRKYLAERRFHNGPKFSGPSPAPTTRGPRRVPRPNAVCTSCCQGFQNNADISALAARGHEGSRRTAWMTRSWQEPPPLHMRFPFAALWFSNCRLNQVRNGPLRGPGRRPGWTRGRVPLRSFTTPSRTCCAAAHASSQHKGTCVFFLWVT